MGIAWNTLVAPRAELVALIAAAGLQPLDEGPYRDLEHRVDQGIVRASSSAGCRREWEGWAWLPAQEPGSASTTSSQLRSDRGHSAQRSDLGGPHVQIPRQEVLRVLRRAGMTDSVDELALELPETVDLDGTPTCSPATASATTS